MRQAIEVEGDTVSAALETALRELRLEKSEVEVEVLDEGIRGLLGFGTRKARVRVTPKVDHAQGASVVEPSPISLASVPQGTDLGEWVERARHFLVELIRLLGSKAEVGLRSEQGQIVFDLIGEDSGFLIGKHGQMLDALEYLTNRVALADRSEATRIHLDAQGYRERRRLYLEELARRLSAHAKRKGKAITLEPMSPRDRRTVHLALQEDRDVTTRSTGEGYYRRLVISPISPGRAHHSRGGS